jgi:hypothetical protein
MWKKPSVKMRVPTDKCSSRAARGEVDAGAAWVVWEAGPADLRRHGGEVGLEHRRRKVLADEQSAAADRFER